MKHHQVNAFDIPYLDVGQGPTLLLIHGSLDDFRIWSPTLGPLSLNRRIRAPGRRHFWPARWDGGGERVTIDQRGADVIGLIEALGPPPIDLVGHGLVDGVRDAEAAGMVAAPRQERQAQGRAHHA